MAQKINVNDVIGTLPLRGNWRYRPYDVPTFTIAPGESRILVDLRRHGWVIWGLVAHNNPSMSCTIELETGTETFVNSFTTNDLFNSGFIQAAPSSWWISRYDSVANIYVVAFTPAEWWPFYRRFKATLENKTSTPATIARAVIQCIEFVEETDSAQ